MSRFDSVIQWLGIRFWRFIDNAMLRVNSLNMTNSRQLFTLGLVVGTGVVYLALAIKYTWVAGAAQWTPDWQWLTFLGVMSGLDVAQFRVKRHSDANFVAAKEAARNSVAVPAVEP